MAGPYYGSSAPAAAPQFSQAELDQLSQLIKSDPTLTSVQKQLDQGATDRPGEHMYSPDQAEQDAGVAPPAYLGTTDAQTGALLDQYKIDPYNGEALKDLKDQAFSTGLSPWAQVQMTQQATEQANAGDKAAAQSQQATDAAGSNLARTGGLSSGSAALLQRGGQRDLMNAQQNVSNQGTQAREGIQAQDITNKQQIKGQLADLETQANQENLNTSTGDLSNLNQFNANRYGQQMQAWAANKSAQAQASAGGGGKK